LAATACSTLKKAITGSFEKEIMTEDTRYIDTAFDKAYWIEHTDRAGFPPEED
jgi:hypothetical protein